MAEHLSACAECASYARDWARLRGGMHRLAEEPAPEASLGFAPRLVRRLQEAAGDARLRDASLEQTGRRFVLAALVATLLLMLGLLVPSTGPARSSSAAELEMAQPETVAAQNYPLFSSQPTDVEFEFAAQPGGH